MLHPSTLSFYDVPFSAGSLVSHGTMSVRRLIVATRFLIIDLPWGSIDGMFDVIAYLIFGTYYQYIYRGLSLLVALSIII